jgi:hypothetical protein
MICPVHECKLKGLIFSKHFDLFKHLSLWHNDLTIYSCYDIDTDITCTKKFSSINSFRKHRYAKHNDPDSGSEPTEQLPSILDSDNLNTLVSVEFSSDEPNIQQPDEGLELDESSLNFIPSHESMPNDFDDFETPIYDLNFFSGYSEIDEENFENLVKRDAEKFAAFCYGHPDINRKRTLQLIDNFTKFMNGRALHNVRDRILSRLRSLGESTENLLKFETDFEILMNPFGSLNSDYRLRKQFEKGGNLIPPIQCKIGEREDFRNTKDAKAKIMTKIDVTIEFIPLRLVLTKFFEIPGILSKTLEYMENLNKNVSIISNFVQGEFWLEKSQNFGHKLVIPIFLYYDDYETNDPLGTHASISKCGAVYISIPTLPPKMVSKKENIFLFFLFNPIDRKEFGNKVIFQKAVDELQYLEERGIVVKNDDGRERQIYFQIGLILGDNLGVHGILGFVEGFTALHPCRFCKYHKSQIDTICHESQCELRNSENYKVDVLRNDVSSTGIKEECVFNSLKNYNVCSNIAVDVMHDLLEGCVKYDVALILLSYIHDGRINLDNLNERIRGFHYDANDSRNKPPEISLHHLNKGSISMTSSETLCFLRILPLLIGDLISMDDERWSLVLLLRNIVEISFSKNVHKSIHKVLEVKIEEWLKTLSRLFPNSKKPKHHHVVHYPRIMKLMGPLGSFSSIRFESKHQDGKSAANVTTNRINVNHTIALQNQFSLFSRLTSDTVNSLRSIKTAAVQKNSKYDPIFESIGIDRSGLIGSTKSVKFFGHEIQSLRSIIIVLNEKGRYDFF